MTSDLFLSIHVPFDSVYPEYIFCFISQHINELSLRIDLGSTLCKAEGLYAQLIGTENNLPDPVRIIIGLEPLIKENVDSEEDDVDDEGGSVHTEHDSSIETVSLGALGGEVAFDRGVNLQFL